MSAPLLEPLESRLCLSVTDVDSSFQSSGTVTPQLPAGTVQAATLDRDGDLLVYGNSPQPRGSTGPFFVNVADVAPNGSVRWVGAVPQGGRTGSNLTPTGAVRLPNGDVVVAIEQAVGRSTDTFLARLNANGTADPSFLVDYGTHRSAIDVTAMAAEPDGSVLVAMTNQQGVFTLERLSGSNGAIVTSYPVDASLAPYPTVAIVTALTTQSDGKVLAAGYTLSTTGRKRLFVVRYKTDGTLDPGFGKGGDLVTSLRLQPHSVQVDSDARIIISAAAVDTTGTTPYVVAVTLAGQVDGTFAGGGVEALNGQLDVMTDFRTANDGTLLAGGMRGGQPAMVHLTAAGALVQAAVGSNLVSGGSSFVAVTSAEKLITQPSPGAFTQSVGFSHSQPTGDAKPPVATLGRLRRIASGSKSYAVTVTYGDASSGIDLQTVVRTNVVLEVAGGKPIRATLSSVTQRSGAVTAVYTFAAPGGTWGPEDAGTYTIQLVGGQVTDNAGNAVAARTLGSFSIRAASAAAAILRD